MQRAMFLLPPPAPPCQPCPEVQGAGLGQLWDGDKPQELPETLFSRLQHMYGQESVCPVTQSC